jgi:uroporphyrinogen III methyltransferase/synthase
MSIVYLVGSGPGDPGLFTVKGAELLMAADVVVYDWLAPKELLTWCREDAELIYVGKKGGDHTLPQDQINALLVQKAREGHEVIVRLKGGDPYMFGRGAEEVEELVAAGIAFEVVPGVTSAIAATAYAGIPLTHRDYASSVSFITGHEGEGKEETAHRWEALAKGTSTLVFFMGVKNLPTITQNLMDHGMDPDMPAALVHWGTTCRQRSFVSTLSKITEEAKNLGYKPPSLLVVGKVCLLKPKLDWFEQRPLLGKGVVVTRAREQASELLGTLQNLGACCYEFPTISIEPMDDYGPLEDAILRLQDYDWLVFTSVNGVEFFFKVLHEIGLDARALGGLEVAAIGPATAERLTGYGILPDFVPEKYVAEHVVQGLVELEIKGKKVLIPRAEKAREVLPEELSKAGAQVDVLPVYRTSLAASDPEEVRQALAEERIDYVTFTSSSTVDNFFKLVPAEEIKKHLGHLRLACIGPITAKTLQGYGFTPHIQPEEFTMPALVQAILEDAAQPK